MKIMFCGKSINKLRFLVVVILALSVFIAILIAVLGRFKPIFIEKASHSAKTQAIDIINKATDDVFSNVSSLDFVMKRPVPSGIAQFLYWALLSMPT